MRRPLEVARSRGEVEELERAEDARRQPVRALFTGDGVPPRLPVLAHAPAPGPLYWDWRCARCGLPCREHGSPWARWRWRRRRMRLPFARATHAHAFRSGRWARLIGVEDALPEGVPLEPARSCYRLQWEDGVEDLVPLNDPSYGMEFQRPTGELTGPGEALRLLGQADPAFSRFDAP